MITWLLVANRGEIARRIARTASAMGIKTVAVYADGDRGAPYVHEADRAVALPGRTATETYLNTDALLEAAAVAGADAVHPGYGFLSERAEFARAVLGAGLTWVGPPPEVIEAMGDKLAAKRLMAAAGVPVLATLDPGTLTFPLLVKAAAGGGGKGMRIVQTKAELPDALMGASREAKAAFGDDTVFMEPYIATARHVEIQILADDQGGIVHCFERECSIQRRHQKIIEESPSTALDDDLRDRMGSAALAAAKAVGYRNAGTVEFVLEPSGDFWFLEVNTRLQVEHPVTEAIIGLDLVREQLLVAQGQPLSVTQADLCINGHAVEARLYAEDPAAGFLPATGVLTEWVPAASPAARWECGVATGGTVGVEFDPLLAKVIVHAPTREEAASSLALALERSRIRGVTTNRDFLVATLRHAAFLAGDTTTDFIERTGVPLERVPSASELRVAGIAAALFEQHHARSSAPVLRSLPSGWRNSVMPPEKRGYDHASGVLEVTYRSLRDGSFLFGDDVLVRLLSVGDGVVTFEEAGRLGPLLHSVAVATSGQHVWVQGADGDVALVARPRLPSGGREGDVAGGLLAPMPGKVLSVHVSSGERVVAGQLLVVLEAMKMEHRVVAPRAGVVTEMRVDAGAQVQGGDLLVVMEES